MADDGLILNFTAADSVLPTQHKFKGGTWRDRLSAKKVAQYRQHNAPSREPTVEGGLARANGASTTEVIETAEVPEARPVKRQRIGSEHTPSSVHDGHATSGETGHERSRGQLDPNRAVISSLFSRNPVTATAVERKVDGDDSESPSRPSNAPLVDDLDTFTSLGLSSTLAAHLLTKLQLKNPTAIQKSSITQLVKDDSDAFIQAETGSGKTLAYLLPLVQRIMSLSKQSGSPVTGTSANGAVHRDSGLFAIILAPTRELCKQISVVLERLLGCANWVVAGTVMGGEKKKSEKARLRKGLNILVATPGRLADHLDNTKVLDVGNVRWLVLDEGDRLMDLGFEEEIQKIVKKLDERQMRNLRGPPGLPQKRTTVLCSATMKMNVQRLGEISLKDAIHIKSDPEGEEDGDSTEKADRSFSAPAQLKQSYAVVAAKLRLVTLVALLKRTFARKGSVMKAIVFVSCADSVDFHFDVLSRTLPEDSSERSKDEEVVEKSAEKSIEKSTTVASAPTLSHASNSVTVHRLHGSLPQQTRTSTLKSFAQTASASLLVCTDVASRGLDLPNIDLVIEYDPAFSADDHLHRIGRTARLGRDGRAMIFLLPGEEERYVEILRKSYRDGVKGVTQSDANDILKKGFGSTGLGAGKDFEAKATEWQLDVERWTLENPQYLEAARRAYQSHVRAYATHTASERQMFNIQNLHLGHLAKAFALRDRPGNINVPGLRPGRDETRKDFKAARLSEKDGQSRKRKTDLEDTGRPEASEASKKMRAKMKEHMASANEFNIA